MTQTSSFLREGWSLGALVAALALTASGCDTSTDLSTFPSSFEAEISGDLSLLLSGEAFFSNTYQQFDDAPARRAFMIELQDLGLPPFHVIRIQRLGWGLPSSGSHTLGSAATSAIFTLGFFRVGEDGEEVQVEVEVRSTSGTLTLTEVGSNRIRGSFQFEGEGQLIPEPGFPPRTIVVEGSGHFTATRGF